MNTACGLILATALTVQAALQPASGCPLSYTVELAIPSRPELIVTFLNRAGDMTGVDSADRAQSRTFLYRGGSVRFIGIPAGATHAVATDINESGHLVGDGYVVGKAVPHATPISDWRAFVYRDGIFSDLGVAHSHALGINDIGDIVGYFTRDANDRLRRAFLLSNGVLKELGSLGGSEGAAATRINNNGEITGNAYTANGEMRAFIYRKGAMTDLGVLEQRAGATRSGGVDINDAGHVVGFSSHAGPGLRAFIYRDGRMEDLGTLGGASVTAFRVNNADAVVGSSSDSQGRERAFVYCDGKMRDLNSLVTGAHADIELQSATAITEDGEILAAGTDARTGKRATYLVKPAAERQRRDVPGEPRLKPLVDPKTHPNSQPSPPGATPGPFLPPRKRPRSPEAWAHLHSVRHSY